MAFLRRKKAAPEPPARPDGFTASAKVAASAQWGDGFGRLATRCVQIIAVTLVAAVLVFVVTRVSLVFIPVTIALIFASAIHPFMAWMRKHGVPALLASWIALLSLIVVVGGLVTLIVWAVQHQWSSLVESASDGLTTLQGYAERLPGHLISQSNLKDAQDAIIGFLTSAQFGRGALAGVGAAAEGLTGVLFTIVVLFFFLKDGPKIWEFMLRPFNGVPYARARRVGDKTVQVLGDYVRGTATVAAADAVGIGIGLEIIGVPLAVPLAGIVFITAFIPIVGATIAGVLAALVALVANGPLAALIVIGVVVLVNQLESHLLQPQIMGHSLNLHPLVILIALTAGSIVGGIVGAILAVPIAATGWGIISVWNGPDSPARPARKKRPETV